MAKVRLTQGNDQYTDQLQEGHSSSSTESYNLSNTDSHSSSDSYTNSHSEGGSNSHTEGGGSSTSMGGQTSHNRGGGTSHSEGVNASSSKGGGTSHSEGGAVSSSTGGSNTYSEGGSTSHSTGGSSSHSTGGSTSQSESRGGSESTTYGKSYASGQVSDRTQEKYNQATQDYVRSQKVEDAYANLQNAMSNKPQFQSKYEANLADLYDRIMNREGFTYDFNKDAMYQQYKDMYQQQGRRAMQDTMGNLAALNNGYGSSYSQSAGQQAYQGYLQQLNDRIPELRQMAYDEYERENNRLSQMYNLTNDAYNREYGQYRDLVGDWTNDRSFNQGMYQDERNFDYQQAMNERNFWQNEYWQERNAEQSNESRSLADTWNTGYQTSKNYQDTESRNYQDTNSTNYQNAVSKNYQDTISKNYSDTTNDTWQNSISQNIQDTNQTNYSDSDTSTYNTTTNHNYSDTSSNNWNNSYSNTHTDTDTHSSTENMGWSNTNTDTLNHSIGETHNTGYNDQYVSNSSGSRGQSLDDGNYVQFSNKNSMDVFNGESRKEVINHVSDLAREANTSGSKKDQNALAKYLDDLYVNGSTGTGGEHVQYSLEDLTNIYNRAITMDVISNGSRNGAQTLSVEELARKLGRLNELRK